jgi:hypothetical protein
LLWTTLGQKAVMNPDSGTPDAANTAIAVRLTSDNAWSSPQIPQLRKQCGWQNPARPDMLVVSRLNWNSGPSRRMRPACECRWLGVWIFDAELIEIGVVFPGVEIIRLHQRSIGAHVIVIDMDGGRVGRRYQRLTQVIKKFFRFVGFSFLT